MKNAVARGVKAIEHIATGRTGKFKYAVTLSCGHVRDHWRRPTDRRLKTMGCYACKRASDREAGA